MITEEIKTNGNQRKGDVMAEDGLPVRTPPEGWVSESDLAKMADTRPSQISTIFKDGRIFEVVRDPEMGNRKKYPPRPCIIPSRYPKPGRKINSLFYDKDDIPEEWMEDKKSRPNPGVILEGAEEDPIGKRIAITFGVDSRNWTAEGERKVFTPIEPPQIEEKEWDGNERRRFNRRIEDREEGNLAVKTKTDVTEVAKGMGIDTDRLRQYGIDLDTLNESEDVKGVLVFFIK